MDLNKKLTFLCRANYVYGFNLMFGKMSKNFLYLLETSILKIKNKMVDEKLILSNILYLALFL